MDKPTLVFWDTEIVFPGGAQPQEGQVFDDIWDLWPFGISTIGVGSSDVSQVRTIADRESMPNGGPGTAMSNHTVQQFLDVLYTLTEHGAKVFAHNGAGFDWQLLARITGEYELCTHLCLNSYDLCFQALCTRGFPIGLQAIAEGLGLADKEMAGGDAPSEWYAGNYSDVLDYVAGDVKRLGRAVVEIMKRGGLSWRTKKGGMGFMPIQKFLTVAECLALPLPDTSWMDSAISREDTIAWMHRTTT
jgi:hypothetical protein